MSLAYPRKRPEPRSETEPLRLGTESLGTSLLDFWRWAYSDLLSNATRGVLAEFIVAKTLGCKTLVREPWDASDLVTPDGIRVEIKTSADLQSWGTTGVSKHGRTRRTSENYPTNRKSPGSASC